MATATALKRAKSALTALFINPTVFTRLRTQTMTSSALSSSLTLGNESKTKIPKLVYGTAWKEERTADLVYNAIKAGFRGLDTAAQPRHYQENLVGDGIRRAIKDGFVKREELYVRSIHCYSLPSEKTLMIRSRSKRSSQASAAKTQRTCPTVPLLLLWNVSTPPSYLLLPISAPSPTLAQEKPTWTPSSCILLSPH